MKSEQGGQTFRNIHPDYLLYRIPYSLYPMKDTFSVGDTLWLEMDFGTEMTDEIGGIKNSFVDYDFRLESTCERIDIDPPLAHTTNYLSINTLIGSDSSINLSASSVSYYEITPVYSSDKYTFKCAFIIQEKGLFLFGTSPYNSEENPFQIIGACDNLSVDIGCVLENELENNFQMLQFASNPAYHKLKPENLRSNFCFFVQ